MSKNDDKRKMILGLTGTLMSITIIIGIIAAIIILAEIWTGNYTWDIPNWGTLLVEIGVAAFAVSISFYFYNRENESRVVSDELIKQQGIRLDELNRSNIKQQEMIKSMSEIIDAQQKEIREKELKKLKDAKYSIEQFIQFLESIEKIGKKFLDIKSNGKTIEEIKESLKLLEHVSSPIGGKGFSSMKKIGKEIAISDLSTIFPKFPSFSNVVKLLDNPPDVINVAIIDITREIYFTSKEYFEFNKKDAPKILYEDYELMEKFLKTVYDTKQKFQQIITQIIT